jgi:hypothetical protein
MRDSAIGSAIGLVSTFAVMAAADRLYTTIRRRRERGRIGLGESGCWFGRYLGENWEAARGRRHP